MRFIIAVTEKDVVSVVYVYFFKSRDAVDWHYINWCEQESFLSSSSPPDSFATEKVRFKIQPVGEILEHSDGHDHRFQESEPSSCELRLVCLALKYGSNQRPTSQNRPATNKTTPNINEVL